MQPKKRATAGSEGCAMAGPDAAKWNLIYLDETTSTNDEVRHLAEAGAPEGTAVIAQYQSAGRGRLGRRWEAPRGSGLLLSILFRPELAPDKIQELSMMCALAVADSVEEEADVRIGLKWPNDIVWHGQKLGGILTEVACFGEEVEYAIVGIGLNVNLDLTQLPAELLQPFTSLSRITRRLVDRESLLQALLRAVAVRYARLRSGISPLPEWAAQLEMLHQPVTVSGQQGAWAGMAEGVDMSGALLVRRPNGNLVRLVAEDVSLGSGVNWQRRSTSAIVATGASVG